MACPTITIISYALVAFFMLFGAGESATLKELDTGTLDASDPAAIERFARDHAGKLEKPQPQSTSFLRSTLVTEEEFRQLMESRRSLQGCQCSINDNLYTGSCGGSLATRDSSNWCTTQFGDVCCGESETDCCKLTAGGITLFVFIVLFIVALIVLCSCACCPCCIWYDKLCCAKRRSPPPPPSRYSAGQPSATANAVPSATTTTTTTASYAAAAASGQAGTDVPMVAATKIDEPAKERTLS